jgi:hypothetical protein
MDFYSKRLNLYGIRLPDTNAVVLYDPLEKRFVVGEIGIDGDITAYTNLATESQPSHFNPLIFFHDGIAVGGEGASIKIKRLDGSSYELILPTALGASNKIIAVTPAGQMYLADLSGSTILLQNVVATGAVNGTNKIFSAESEIITVSINGLEQIKNIHYTQSIPSEVTLDEAPLTGDVVTFLCSGPPL